MTDKIENSTEVVEKKEEEKVSSQEQAPEGESTDIISEDDLTKLLDEVEKLRQENARLESSRASQQERLKRILLGGNSTSGETGKNVDTSKESSKDTSDDTVDYSYLTLEKFF